MITRADSEYSIGSFKKHGFLIGWMMTTDRLFRCGRDEVRLSPQVISGNRQGVPLGNYDAVLTSLNNLTTIAPNQEVADEAHYQKGWVYLEMGLWGSARERFEKI
jgi:hypothetical protein